jgi:Fe-S cluster assembly iron-binding protein IscA
VIEVTEIAKKKIMTLMRDQEGQGTIMEGIRVTYSGILPTLEYRLAFVGAGKEEAHDVIISAKQGVVVAIKKSVPEIIIA